MLLFFSEALETERKKESQEDSVETFEVAFERIKEMTGLEDLDELVRRYVSAPSFHICPCFLYLSQFLCRLKRRHTGITFVGGGVVVGVGIRISLSGA